MRIKDFWQVFPLPTKIKLLWDRITLTRTTTVYFVFSILHCIGQLVFQAQAFHVNVNAADFLTSIAKQGDTLGQKVFYIFDHDLRVVWDGNVGDNILVLPSTMEALMNLMTYLSSATANGMSSNSEQSLFPSFYSCSNSVAIAGGRKRSSSDDALVKRNFASSIEVVEINGTVQVAVNDIGGENKSAILDDGCLSALGWPVQVLRNTRREDLTFIMFQIWVLGMSFVAILNESVPHTIATLLTHLVATGWAGFRIFDTIQFRDRFTEVTTNGACSPINLLPTYWQSRSAAEISGLALNAAALLVSAILSWKLTKSFGWQTFKRVGASVTISRIYKIVLTLSIVIQLSLFFIVTSIALWLDQLWNGAIGRLADRPMYRPFLIVTLILLPLWLAFGWYAVRRERKNETTVFLTMCLGYLVGWGTMFYGTTFRWTYVTWPFFAVMTTTSVFLTSLSLILGIVCRLNFGKGLPNYLKAQEPIEEGFEPVIAGDPEKAGFSSNNQSTYSGTQDSLSLKEPSQNAVPPRMLPVRIINQAPLQQPPPAMTRPI